MEMANYLSANCIHEGVILILMIDTILPRVIDK